MTTPTIAVAVTAGALMAGISTLHAAAVVDTFGSGANAFSIDFAFVGNAGNPNDAGAGGGQYFGPYGGVTYNYRIGVTEVPQHWIEKATNLGMTNVVAGPYSGLLPAAEMSWYEAAAFVNWLNTSKGHQAAYDLTFNGDWTMALWSSAQAWQTDGENLYRHKDAYYFLPSEDEWFKAAYHKNDGVTANYWDYPTASNSIPTAVSSGTGAGTAVYNGGVINAPADVDNNGGLSAYGTRGQGGNLSEWNESAYDGLNNSASESRPARGGSLDLGEMRLRASGEREFVGFSPEQSGNAITFRVASIPEPSAAILLAGSALMLSLRASSRRPLKSSPRQRGVLPRSTLSARCQNRPVSS